MQTAALETLRVARRRGGWRGVGERALVRAAQRGSAEAFAELFRRHWPRAHRAAWLVVRDATAAEDVAQEAFLAAVRSLDRFDRSRLGALRPDAHCRRAAGRAGGPHHHR